MNVRRAGSIASDSSDVGRRLPPPDAELMVTGSTLGSGGVFLPCGSAICRLGGARCSLRGPEQ